MKEAIITLHFLAEWFVLSMIVALLLGRAIQAGKEKLCR